MSIEPQGALLWMSLGVIAALALCMTYIALTAVRMRRCPVCSMLSVYIGHEAQCCARLHWFDSKGRLIDESGADEYWDEQ